MKDPSMMDADKVHYFLGECEKAKRQNMQDRILEKLMAKEQYSGRTAAHACAKNGHTALLVKVI